MSEWQRIQAGEATRRRMMAEEEKRRQELGAMRPTAPTMAEAGEAHMEQAQAQPPMRPEPEEGGMAAQNAGALMGMGQEAPERQRKMTRERLKKANDTLAKYKSGKARLEARLMEDEKWWRGHAWNTMQEQGNHLDPKRPTKWLTNVILGKHADMMDAYPEPVILPREEGDQAEARTLTSILPVVLEQNHFKSTYRLEAWEKIKTGTAAYAVYWDQSKWNGLGDIAICGVDLLNLYWEPGITDIQKSRNVFFVSSVDKELLIQQHPELADKNLQSDFTMQRYQTEDRADAGDKALVVDWYYHTFEGGQKKLQYCKYVGLETLYSSEDDPQAAESGWYADGNYPFVLDVLFPQKESPAGWGYIDLGKDAQESIDLLDYAINMNARAGAIPRYFRRDDSAINEKDFMDFTKPIVPVAGGLGEVDMQPIQHAPLDGIYVTQLNNKIEELKQTCGNQDVSNGITSGVTAASGIAAQQEAAGRTSRDGNAGTYEAYGKIIEMVIERIRQFYDIPRTFRIIGEKNAYEFVQFDNSGLQMQMNPAMGGEDMGWRKPVFDIQVNAQKQNAYTKMAQNELAIELLNAGVFNPQMVDQSLLLLSMMDFPKKEELERKVQQMGTMQDALAYWQQMALQFAAQADPEAADMIAQQIMMGGGGQMMAAAGAAAAGGASGAPFAGEPGTQNAAHMVKARAQSREIANPI